MAPQKCSSVVLSTAPYRESSMLVYLFSREFGRIHGLAKGVRRGDRRGVPIERGSLVEHMTYFRRHSNLHQIAECQIIDFFPEIRRSLEKTAVRDAVLDLLLSGVKESGVHTDLFDFLKQFLSFLEQTVSEESVLLARLSKTFFIVSGHLGFALDFRRCSLCGISLKDKPMALAIEAGAVYCEGCSGREYADALFSAETGTLLNRDTGISPEHVRHLSKNEIVSLLRSSWEFCRYHLDLRRESPALAFMETLFGIR